MCRYFWRHLYLRWGANITNWRSNLISNVYKMIVKNICNILIAVDKLRRGASDKFRWYVTCWWFERYNLFYTLPYIFNICLIIRKILVIIIPLAYTYKVIYFVPITFEFPMVIIRSSPNEFFVQSVFYS